MTRLGVRPKDKPGHFALQYTANCRCQSGRAGRTVRAVDDSVLPPRTVWTLVKDGRAQLIDLRGREEVDLTRIPGARAIPLDELPSELVTLDRERPVVFVSGTGRKATEAMEVERSAGITACAVEGGVGAWIEAGLPIESRVAHGSPSPR